MIFRMKEVKTLFVLHPSDAKLSSCFAISATVPDKSHFGLNFGWEMVQKLFKIQAREVRVVSKIDSGGLQGVQGEKKLFLMPWGRLKGLLQDAIWEAKIVSKSSRKHFQDATEFEEPFGMVLGRLGN